MYAYIYMYARPHRDAGKGVGCVPMHDVTDGRKIRILHFSLVSLFLHCIACMFALHCAALRVLSRVCVVVRVEQDVTPRALKV